MGIGVLELKYLMVIDFFIAFFTVFILSKRFIEKSYKRKLTAKDMYKKDKSEIPKLGGLLIIAGIIMSLIFFQFFTTLMTTLLIFYFAVLMFALYGLTDDIFGFKMRNEKIIVLFLLALPVALLTKDTTLNLFFTTLDIGPLFAFVIAPIYVMVVANLINMHSGFNGLAAGTALIMLFFAFLKALMLDGENVFLIVPLLGALSAFMYFNVCPSKIILGNVGSFLIGSGLGAFLVIEKMLWFGAFILIPHIVNFLMWVYWKATMHNNHYVKFGKLRKDGTIEPPNKLTLKFLVTGLFRVNELQAVLICYLITAVFGVMGLLLF
jgi:UDP-N-acetylglucosamine--dolichyl-phosphate N-acetylglucosaminephosphotransferase